MYSQLDTCSVAQAGLVPTAILPPFIQLWGTEITSLHRHEIMSHLYGCSCKDPAESGIHKGSSPNAWAVARSFGGSKSCPHGLFLGKSQVASERVSPARG